MGEPKLGSFFVRVTVTGHASMRWKGSKDYIDAMSKNLELSTLRAKNIGEVVKQQLKRNLPDLDIEVKTKSVNSFGSPDVQRPNDNEPFTRIVHVLVSVVTKEVNTRTTLHPNRKINARTSLWYLRVTELFALAGGLAGANVDLYLRNAVSGKEVRYQTTVWGGGIGAAEKKNAFQSRTSKAPNVVSPNVGKNALPLSGEEIFFMTNRDMGFADFDEQFIRIGIVGAKIWVGAEFNYLSFESLGKGAEVLVFKHNLGIGRGASLMGALMSGRLKMVGYNPGDYFEVPVDNTDVRVQNESEHANGIVLIFPTGKAGLNDLSVQDRNKLTDFLASQAQNIKVIMEHYHGPFQHQP